PDGDLFGLRLPAQDLLAHAKTQLLQGDWETARTVAMLVLEQHRGDHAAIAIAEQISKKAAAYEQFSEQWSRVQTLANESGEQLAEAWTKLLEIASSFTDETAEIDGLPKQRALMEFSVAISATQAFAREEFGEALEICNTLAPSKFIDFEFFRDRAVAEFNAWKGMQRLTAIWNTGDWGRIRVAAEELELKGTQQQPVLEKRKNVARELGKAYDAMEGADFKR